MQVGKRQEVWSRWMKTYWESRLGVSPALDSEELIRMVQWSIELEDAFPDAVKLILAGPAIEKGDMTMPCLRLQKSASLNVYPQESAQLLRFLVRSQSGPQFGDYIFELVKELTPLGAETAVLIDVCQLLADLGDSRAENLKTYVEDHGGPSVS
jgi:hypothetical protein